MISAFYGALLGMLYVVLTLHVIFGRWKYKVSLGDGGEKELRRRIRAHGNFTENVPFTLVLLFLAESTQLSLFGLENAVWIHLFGIALCLGRSLHALGFRHHRSVNLLRQIGMALSLTVSGCLALWLCIVLLPRIL